MSQTTKDEAEEDAVDAEVEEDAEDAVDEEAVEGDSKAQELQQQESPQQHRLSLMFPIPPILSAGHAIREDIAQAHVQMLQLNGWT